MPASNALAQVVLPSTDLTADIDFFSELGFRLENIFPSDDPAVAFMHGNGMSLRLDRDSKNNPGVIHLLTDESETTADGKKELQSPGGTEIKIFPKTYQLHIPETRHAFEVRELKDNDSWVIGRAGMLYRDLITDRLGGSIIASHINIPKGGPVPDVVHYHTIGFQLIFCYKGWVKLVYEDQGPPFILEAGDCVTQPPEIRHRVLEASDQLEVIEIGVPSDHMTTIDHEMELPTKQYLPDREFQGQTFCHHISKNAAWSSWRIPSFQFRETGINKATKGMASVQVIKTISTDYQRKVASHDSDILFTFIMSGTLAMKVENQGTYQLKARDAFVMPPNLKYEFLERSNDLELLEVSLPGDFKTTIN